MSSSCNMCTSLHVLTLVLFYVYCANMLNYDFVDAFLLAQVIHSPVLTWTFSCTWHWVCLSLAQVDGCDDGMLEWEPSSYPDGAHLVNIQRGDKGFGVILVQQKVCTCKHIYIKLQYAVSDFQLWVHDNHDTLHCRQVLKLHVPWQLSCGWVEST